jgi:hypothetical protein
VTLYSAVTEVEKIRSATSAVLALVQLSEGY